MESHEIRPLGASRAKEVDVRVIAATNKDLQRMVDEGKFRSDLPAGGPLPARPCDATKGGSDCRGHWRGDGGGSWNSPPKGLQRHGQQVWSLGWAPLLEERLHTGCTAG